MWLAVLFVSSANQKQTIYHDRLQIPSCRPLLIRPGRHTACICPGVTAREIPPDLCHFILPTRGAHGVCWLCKEHAAIYGRIITDDYSVWDMCLDCCCTWARREQAWEAYRTTWADIMSWGEYLNYV